MSDEQPKFKYWECRHCEFDLVTTFDTSFDGICAICAGDTGHSNVMHWRIARSTDSPEGTDARKETMK